MRLNTAAAPYFSGVTYVDNDFFFTVTVNIGNSSVIQTFNIISAAVVDGKARDLSWYGEFNGIQYVPLEIFGYREFYYFPNFNESLFYDPGISSLSFCVLSVVYVLCYLSVGLECKRDLRSLHFLATRSLSLLVYITSLTLTNILNALLVPPCALSF